MSHSIACTPPSRKIYLPPRKSIALQKIDRPFDRPPKKSIALSIAPSPTKPSPPKNLLHQKNLATIVACSPSAVDIFGLGVTTGGRGGRGGRGGIRIGGVGWLMADLLIVACSPSVVDIIFGCICSVGRYWHCRW